VGSPGQHPGASESLARNRPGDLPDATGTAALGTAMPAHTLAGWCRLSRRCWVCARVADEKARMNTVERRARAVINPWSTAFARWCHSAARSALTGYGAPRRRLLRGGRDVVRPTPAGAPADGMPRAAQVEPLAPEDVASAVALAVRVLRVRPGDRGEEFASDITDELRQVFVAKANGQVVAYGRVVELAAGEAGPGTPAGCYLSGVLVDPGWRGQGIATDLTRARLRWAFARTGTVFYVAGADNAASLRLHAALGFQEVMRFDSDRSPAGVDVLSQLVRSTATCGPAPLEAQP